VRYWSCKSLFIKVSLAEALAVKRDISEGEIYFQRAISDPFLSVGAVGIIVGAVLAFTLPPQEPKT